MVEMKDTLKVAVQFVHMASPVMATGLVGANAAAAVIASPGFVDNASTDNCVPVSKIAP